MPCAVVLAGLGLTTTACGGGGSARPAGLVQATLAVPKVARYAPFDVPRTLLLPAGWRAAVWARVHGARFAAWTPNGRLLVSVPATGAIVELEPASNQAAPPHSRVRLSGLSEPQGLAFDVLSGRDVLYLAEPGRLLRYTWNGLRRTVVADALPDASGVDRLKGIAVGPDHTVYVGVGSEGAGGGPSGVVLGIRPDGTQRTVARGLHNAEGLAIDAAGNLWAAVNSADELPDEIVKIDSGHVRHEQRLLPHTAPLGFHFLQESQLPSPWRDGAVLAVHGARDPAAPSWPASVRWFARDGRKLGVPTTLAGGFRHGAVRWGRPTDAAAGPDGSLYVVDDTAGAVYRLTPP